MQSTDEIRSVSYLARGGTMSEWWASIEALRAGPRRGLSCVANSARGQLAEGGARNLAWAEASLEREGRPNGRQHTRAELQFRPQTLLASREVEWCG
jgi:hypothetical protein